MTTFNYKNNVTNRAEKVEEKNYLIFMFPSKVMVLKLSEELQYLQFCAHLNQKPKSVKTIYIYASESSYYSLTDYDHMVYRGLSHRS